MMSYDKRQVRSTSNRHVRMHFERLEDRRLLVADLRLLKDINTNLSFAGILSVAEVGGLAYFGARTSSGDALWKTDGSDAGTFVVREFRSESSNLKYFTAVNGTLYFVVNSSFGQELWKSDGTYQGTALVKDINPGAQGSFPKYLTNVAGTLYFTAKHPQTGTELWKSDGTSTGTVQVRDIMTGAADSTPQKLTAVGSTLFFTAQSTSGIELFKSNGTSATTKVVRDLAPGTESSTPSNLVNLGGTLYFSAAIDAINNGLWKTDGTAAGTKLVKNLQTSTDTIQNALVIGSKVFFSAGESGNFELWASDGTLAGTQMVEDILPGPGSSLPKNFLEFGGQLFFTARTATGRELWRSNGTSAGTFQVKDIRAGSAGSEPEILRRVGSTLYFSADDGIQGRELWKTNGTTVGTLLVKDIYPGPEASMFASLGGSRSASVDGKLLFVAAANAPDAPIRLWTSAGTAATTNMLTVVGTETADSNPIDKSPGFANLNGTIYFTASSAEAENRDLWKTNGISSGTVLVKDFSGVGITSSNLLSMAGALYFVAQDLENGIGLWKTDGTTAGTVLIHAGGLGPNASSVEQLTIAGNTIYFTDGNWGLWKSNGTLAGTSLVVRSSSDPNILFSIGSTVYMAAGAFPTGSELWKSDGTLAGTVLVKDIRPGNGSSFLSKAVKVGSTFYFTANDGIHGRELWSTKGTSATTVMVKDLASGYQGSDPSQLTAVGSTLFFTTFQGLWKSNETEESTVRITDNNTARYLVNVSGKLFFAANAGPALGVELWKSDGTILGTSLVKDIQDGPGGSSPEDLKNIGGRLYFSALTTAYGRELWSSNGTSASTVLEKDLNPGVFGSSPKFIFVLEDQLMLIAAGANAGRELFAERKSIIGPTGEGEWNQLNQTDQGSPVVSIATEQAVDIALLAWAGDDEMYSARRTRFSISWRR